MAYTTKDKISFMVPSLNTGNPQFYPEDLAVVTNQSGYDHMVQFDCIFTENSTIGGVTTTIWGGFELDATHNETNMLELVALPCPPYNKPLKKL